MGKLLGKTDNIWLIENSCNLPQNRIISGAPGTGKSFKYETEKDEYFSEYQYERVTFHPAYSYAHFLDATSQLMGQRELSTNLCLGHLLECG